MSWLPISITRSLYYYNQTKKSKTLLNSVCAIDFFIDFINKELFLNYIKSVLTKSEESKRLMSVSSSNNNILPLFVSTILVSPEKEPEVT